MSDTSVTQPEIPNFYLPYGGKLDPENRWIQLINLVPWEVVAASYQINGGKPNPDGIGAPALPARVAFGALYVKERMGCSDGELVEQIKENPYLQCFLGYTEMLQEAPFDASMMAHFRVRFTQDGYDDINGAIITEAIKAKEEKQAADSSGDDDSEPPTHGGKLLIDASATPADITYPTDLKLLNATREKLEHFIDQFHEPFVGKMKKPRTYRKKARRDYLNITKLKRVGKQKMRASIRKQLGYVKRNLDYIDQYIDNHGADLSTLSNYDYRCLIFAHEIYRQQLEMWQNRVHRIDDRIVSLCQPWVRPIVRGKQSAKVEFGAKISISVLADGFVSLDKMGWDAYNEGNDLIPQASRYRDRFGYWPESIHADKIYLSRANRSWCKERDIRLSGPALGRPRKMTEANRKELKAQAKLEKQDGKDRNAVEGKFGNAKRRGTLARIMAKLPETAVSVVNMGFIVLNLEKWLVPLLWRCYFVFIRADTPRNLDSRHRFGSSYST